MSLQKGNSQRTRAQKHKNQTVFNNSMHDTSQRTKMLNNMEVHGVCQRCKDCIDWKVKYKKYKPLKAPKCCTKCHEKAITAAYRTICRKCARSLQVCEKCGEAKTVVPKTLLTPQEQVRQDAEFERQLKSLPERKRRSLLRFMTKTRADPESDPGKFGEEMRAKIDEVKEGLGDGDLSDDSDDVSDDDGDDDDGGGKE